MHVSLTVLNWQECLSDGFSVSWSEQADAARESAYLILVTLIIQSWNGGALKSWVDQERKLNRS